MNQKLIIGLIMVLGVGLVVFALKGERAPMTDTLKKAEKATTERPTQVKEFSINSFVEMVDGKPKPQFDVKELTVTEGDMVRIKVKVTKGMHDFNIDELGIHKATPLNEEVVIEFKADKAGEFVYYCNMPGHRAAGHWGTLKVLKAE